MRKTFFISDPHFGHRNILTFDNRPFGTIEEHDEALINNWNSVVGEDDEVWILGDFSWYGSTKTIEIFSRLNGKKNLCIGNHDHKLLRDKRVRSLFNEVCDYKELQVDGYNIVLCHYPIPCYRDHFYGWIHFYGHVHVSFEWNMMERMQYEMTTLYGKQCDMINVGCMMPYMGYTPRTAKDILEGYKGYKELLYA